MKGDSARGRKTLHKKIVILGDGACGKTSMLHRYVSGRFTEHYEPTIFENTTKEVTVDGVTVELNLWDTAGQEDYDKLRSLSYADTDLIMCCFSVENVNSLNNVIEKWVPEIEAQCGRIVRNQSQKSPGIPLTLLGCKCDLREEWAVNEAALQGLAIPPEKRSSLRQVTKRGVNPVRIVGGATPIQYQEAVDVAQRIGASCYVECSAKSNKGINEAFVETVKVLIRLNKKNQSKGCIIM